MAESKPTSSQSLLNLGALSGNVDRLGLTTAGSFLYRIGSTSVAQNGTYDLNTTKSIGVWSRPPNAGFDKGTYFLNGISKGITLSGSSDATGTLLPGTDSNLTLGNTKGEPSAEKSLRSCFTRIS